MEGDIAVGENVWEVRDDLASPLPQDAIKVRYGRDFPPSRHRTASQLTTDAILGVVLPLVLLGGIAFFFLTCHLEFVEAGFARSRAALTENIVRTDLMAQPSSVARQIDAFLVERIESPEEIVQLNHAVSRLGRAFMSVPERHRHQR